MDTGGSKPEVNVVFSADTPQPQSVDPEIGSDAAQDVNGSKSKSTMSGPKFVAPHADEVEESATDTFSIDPSGEVAMQERQRLLMSHQLVSHRSKSTRSICHLQRLSLAEMDSTEDEDEDRKKPRLRWYYAIFLFSAASLIVCLLQLFTGPTFGVWMTSAQIEKIGIAPDGCEGGLEHCICPRETICATNTYSIVFLTLARCSAFFDYPLYMMMFLSKCHNINNIFRRTVLREWIDFADMHKVHKLFGVVVGIETMSHSFFHLLRWGLNGDISLLWKTNTGITGLIAAIITPLVCWPMFVPALKQNMKFELRKGLHYLAVVWAIALLWHAPSRIYYLIGIPALIYAVDYLFGFFIRNTLIENAHFERYGETGVALRFKNPQKWGEKPKTSYLYIMCPWISKNQWHAFTMFPEPTKDDHTMLCIGASGDWTKQLHDKIKVPSYKSLYVLGPYLSEFSDKAVSTSNAIAVASGIGITPTLSLMLNYAGKKRVNIIWMCRDAGLVEYILHKVNIEEITKNSYAFIYYTGKRNLALPKHLPVNLFIFTCRPKLEESIAGIITSIQSGNDLPEVLYESQLKIANVPFKKRMQTALLRVLEIYGADKMFEYAVGETQKEEFQHSKAELVADDHDPEAIPFQGPARRLSIIPLTEDEVSLEGLDAMISEFCGGIGEYSCEDLKEMFDQIDRFGTGFIDREDFDEFLIELTKKNERNSEQTKELASQIDKMMSKTRVQKSMHGLKLQESYRRSTSLEDSLNVMQSMILKSESRKGFVQDWTIFYCGGSNGIKKNLKDIAKKYGLAFAVEKFDW